MSTFSELSKIRHDFLRKIRAFFEAREFIEVQTPTLVTNPGLEPYLEYFSTRWIPSMSRGEEQRFFLPTSPEYHLKKALGEGLPRIYELAKSFRNGEVSKRHEPEFLMLEWYRNPGDYSEIADDTFELIRSLAREFSPHPSRWENRDDITVKEAFQLHAGVDLDTLKQKSTFEDDFHLLLLEKIERKLGPDSVEFLWDYPLEMAALSRRKKENPEYCERFEVYWNGFELANAFGELTDPVEQRSRFVADQEKRRQLYPNEVPPEMDDEILTALAKIRTPCAGIALGVDRLLQCILEKKTIQEVLLFPKQAKLEK